MPKTSIITIEDALRQAYHDCVASNGARTEILVPKYGHRIKAYGVGQSILRIDICYAVQRNFMGAEDDWAPPETGPGFDLEGNLIVKNGKDDKR